MEENSSFNFLPKFVQFCIFLISRQFEKFLENFVKIFVKTLFVGNLILRLTNYFIFSDLIRNA